MFMRLLSTLQLASILVTVILLALLKRWFLFGLAVANALLVTQQIAHFAIPNKPGSWIVFSASLSLCIYGFTAGSVATEKLAALEEAMLASSTASSVAIGIGLSVMGHELGRMRRAAPREPLANEKPDSKGLTLSL